MSLRNTLNRLMQVVIAEAERNPDFEAVLNDALGSAQSRRKPSTEEALGHEGDGGAKRGNRRRAPAVLDPVQVVREGEAALRGRLEMLSLEQLRDIVADSAMDPSRLVMKWNKSERVIDRIVEMSIARAHKGNAFRKPTDEVPSMATRSDETSSTQTQLADGPPHKM